MVRTTSQPQTVADAKAKLRTSVDQLDYLQPLRQHPWGVVGFGLLSGFLVHQASKNHKDIIFKNVFDLGVQFARRFI